MSWLEVRACFDEAPVDWSPIAELFRKHGCENTAELDDPPSLAACVVDLPASSPQVLALRTALLAQGAAEVRVGPYEEVDWEQTWKQFFKPRRVGERLVVRPTWQPFEAIPQDVVIVLDPGQAFGTGDHATTRMCLRLLEQVPLAGKRVLDVGCGSGILSIAAGRLGAASLHAIDIDPIAVEVAKQNAAINEVKLVATTSDGLGTVGDGFDLVLSNIISAALIRLAPDVSTVVKRGGRWIVSGILESNWNDVCASAERVGFVLEEQLEEDGWVAATFSR